MDIELILKEEFQDDPLMQEIKINNLIQYLYTDEILSMHTGTTYSTVEAGRIIGRKDSTIRNYFRTELVDYIQPEKSGKYYRLNYQSVFKLHMILLLVDKANLSTADIAYFCGLDNLVSVSRNRSNPKKEEQSNLWMKGEIDKLNKGLVYQMLKDNMNDKDRELFSLQLELSNREAEVHALELNLNHIRIRQENKMLEDKYFRMLDFTLRKTVNHRKQNSKGFLQRIFNGKDSDLDVDEVMNEARADVDSEIKFMNNDETNEVQNQIDQKNDEIKQLKDNIESLKLEIKNTKAFLSRFKEEHDITFRLDDINVSKLLEDK